MAGPAAGAKIRAADFTGMVSNIQAADETGYAGTSYGPGTNVCGVTFVAPTSGRVEIKWYARAESNGANTTRISVAVRNGGVIGSGTAVLAANDGRAIEHVLGADNNDERAMVYPLTGLTPGATYNAQIEMIVSSLSADIFDRALMVTGVW
jgi:hypothetical protein